MNQERVARMAALLIEARRTHSVIAHIPDDARPATLEEGAAVQAEVARRLGASFGGWKVGVPPDTQTYCAPLYDSVIHASLAQIRAADHPMLAIEGEIAFRMARDLPERAAPYRAEEVIAAVAAAHVAIEIGDCRIADFMAAPLGEKVADNMGNGAFVHGDAIADWQHRDLTTLHARLVVNGEIVVDKTSSKTGDTDIIGLLTWLANHLRSRGGLKAGQYVTTGTWTGQYTAHAGDEVTVQFENMGEARARFG